MNRSVSGKTLLELMIALTLLSALTGIAYPSFTRMLNAQQLLAHQHLLHAHLNLARHQAVSGGRPVVVCPREGRGCAGGPGDWSLGWLVFEDIAGHSSCDLDDEALRCSDHGGRVLAVGPVVEQLEIMANQNVARRVRFNAMGMSYGYTGRFSICDQRGLAAPLGLVIAQSGRVRRASASELLPCRP